MSCLSDANLTKIKNVYQRNFLDLPLAKDLPRLAKYISICDEDGVRLTYLESKRLDIEKYTELKGSEFLIFYQVRRVLLTLCLALEGSVKCKEVDVQLLSLLDNQDFLLPEVMNTFLEKHFGGDTGKVVRVLKCVNQAAIAPSLIELKMAMGVENTTKDVAGTWRIFIVLSSDSLTVTHTKKEICIKNRFILEWKLKFSLSYNQMDQLRNVSFGILDMSFNSTLGSKGITELRNLVKPYITNKLDSLIGSNPQIMNHELSEKDLETVENLSVTYPGEIYFCNVPNILYFHHQLSSQHYTEGHLLISNFAICFNSSKLSFKIPITCIAKLSKKEKKEIEIISKDMRVYRFVFQGKYLKSFLDSYNNVLPKTLQQTFAYAHSKAIIRNLTAVASSSFGLIQNGWRYYSIENEFKRMNMSLTEWRISDLNSRYQLSKSYPKLITVPRSISDAELLMSCRYRSDGRVPILTWIHRNKTILCHGSYPLVDIKTALGREDEKVLSAIIKTTTNNILNNDNNNSSSLSRSTSTSNFSNKRKTSQDLSIGKSSRKLLKSLRKTEKSSLSSSTQDLEDDIRHSFYFITISHTVNDTNLKYFEFSDNFISSLPDYISFGKEVIFIDNLVLLKDSYKKLQKICSCSYNQNNEEHWLSLLDNTRWFEQLRCLMEVTNRIVEIMENGSSLFMSCPKEWDRGCQISSLAQLWMDPYYRTIEGFIILIEKEWLSFGHSFSERSNLLSNDNSGNDYIPVFIQWLDCIWQSLQQFPNYFEFNNNLLVDIAEQSLSGVYGTFLYNSDFERRSFLAKMNTESFWTGVQNNFKYRNPFYTISPNSTIIPSYNCRVLNLWTSFYFRWFENSIGELPRIGYSPTGKDILSITNTDSGLSEQQELENHIMELESALYNIEFQIEAKHNVLTLLNNGETLPNAIKKVVYKSINNISDIVGCNNHSPLLSRRKSGISTVVASHQAAIKRNSLRRSSLTEFDFSGMEDEKPSRKSKSVYLQKDELDEYFEQVKGMADD